MIGVGRMTAKKRGRSGFTMVEVLVAGIIAALVLGLVGRVLIMGSRSATMARRQMAALHAARAVMEAAVRDHFDSPALSLGRHAVPGGHYDVTSADSRTKDITVRMSWIGINNRTNWVELTTSVSSALHFD